MILKERLQYIATLFPEARFIARDADGFWFLYGEKPTFVDGVWDVRGTTGGGVAGSITNIYYGEFRTNRPPEKCVFKLPEPAIQIREAISDAVKALFPNITHASKTGYGFIIEFGDNACQSLVGNYRFKTLDLR